MTILGISSLLHTWNPSSERFILGKGNNAIRNPIIVDGKCEILTSRQDFLFFVRPRTYQSLEQYNNSISHHRHSPASFGIVFIGPKIKVGILELTLNNNFLHFFRPAKEGPTIHAFAHSLSSALVYIRDALVNCPPSNAQIASGEKLMLSEICDQHSIYEDLLVALAALCNRVRRRPFF